MILINSEKRLIWYCCFRKMDQGCAGTLDSRLQSSVFFSFTPNL